MTSAGNSVNIKYVYLDKLDKFPVIIINKTHTRAYPWNAQTVNTNCPVTVNFNYR